MIKGFSIGVAMLGIVLAAHTVSATEGGTGHYVPGTVATIIDNAPTQPGWVFNPMYLYYGGDASASASVPVAGEITLGVDVESNALVIGGLYTLSPTVLGARYTAGIYLPYVWVDVDAEVDTAPGSVSRRDTASGIGDTTLIPVMMAWEHGFWQYNAMFSIYAPSGEYKAGQLANTGLNYWSFDPTVGASYNNDKNGFNAALYVGTTFNTENPDTNYESGAMLHLDGSVQQLLPLGSGYVGIGAEVFLLDQIQGDSGSGARLGDFKGQSWGIGPVLTYLEPIGEENLVVEARWLPEIETENEPEGDYVYLKLVYQF